MLPMCKIDIRRNDHTHPVFDVFEIIMGSHFAISGNQVKILRLTFSSTYSGTV